jgi:hypothetical protein
MNVEYEQTWSPSPFADGHCGGISLWSVPAAADAALTTRQNASCAMGLTARGHSCRQEDGARDFASPEVQNAESMYDLIAITTKAKTKCLPTVGN